MLNEKKKKDDKMNTRLDVGVEEEDMDAEAEAEGEEDRQTAASSVGLRITGQETVPRRMKRMQIDWRRSRKKGRTNNNQTCLHIMNVRTPADTHIL